MADDTVDQVAGAIIRQLKEGTAPWQKPWQPGERFMPYNPTTGNAYHGMNALWLMSEAERRGLGDARWLTFKQAEGQGAYVRKGEKGTPIQFWKWQGLEPVRDAGGRPVLGPDGQPVRELVRYERPRVWSAVVFNAGQIEGLAPTPERPVPAAWQRHQRAETILSNSGALIRHVAGDRACYRLGDDAITLPNPDQFPPADAYYATALHELGHWSGHPSRLARDLAHPFGSEGYAQEELRAEIGSLMLGEQLGIGHDPSQHVAYVASWIKVLEQDPREVFRAAADAEKIAKLIRSFERVPEQTVERETALPPPDGQDAVPEPTRVPTLIRETSPALQPPGPERTYLAVPYDEKDDARQLGARWDRTEKAWYVPAGVDLEAFTPWLPAKGSVHIAVDADPAGQFAEAIRACGLRLDGPARMDGQRHRLPVEGDQARERSGAYQGQLDGRPAGVIQNNRTGVRVNWTAGGPAAALGARDRAQMAAQAAEKRHDRAHERERQAERTAQQVDALWTAATPARAHPYLADKGVQAHGLRQDADGRLMVPVQDAAGRIRGLQRIGKDGVTRFEPNDRVEGGHYVIGDVTRPGPLLIAEGFVTAATLHELTGLPAIVAFTAGNLRLVAETYRGRYPDRVLYVAGDNDRQRAAESDGPGPSKLKVGRVLAEAAAATINGQAVIPEFAPGSSGTNWNDLAQSQGRPHAAGKLHVALAIGDREQTVRGLAAARDGAVPEPVGPVFGRSGKVPGRDRGQTRGQEHGHER